MKSTRSVVGGSDFQSVLDQIPVPRERIGVIVVDHGSRREESNQQLLEVVQLFAARSALAIVEPAHMELAHPTIAEAFTRCAERGAELIVVHPYFLLPGRHWDQDIPALAAAAAAACGDVPYLVTAPLGVHPLLADIVQHRLHQCLAHATGATDGCELCEKTDKCRIEWGTSKKTRG